MPKIQFPQGFFWGAATSAHQVEGNLKNNWTVWEKTQAASLAKNAVKKWQPWQQAQFPEMFEKENYLSGQACDHYNRFQEDFDLAKSLKHNAHRFSIEWSRIEPREGQFSKKEIEHYRQVILALHARGIEPFVCLWHWTHPVWLEEKGGVASQEFSQYFARFVKKIAAELGGEVKFWLTINEPMSVIPNGFVLGNWPPQKKNPLLALRVYKNLAAAHRRAYDVIHQKNPQAQVGFANIMAYFEPHNRKSVLDNLIVRVAEYFGNWKFLKMTGGKNDFLALQYYFHHRLSFWRGKTNRNEKVTDLGWEIYQAGIYHLLGQLEKYKLPIYITENGLADATDEKREQFIKQGLKWIGRALQEGVDVRGYFYWSLLDNFEWDKGFWPRFGLVKVDFKTQKRTVRPSAKVFAKICQTNELET